ncbi:hypothetical protein [Nonomuraea sp. NPDC049784]|uniref:hypothetical protein n=1 Tax=Nonomuraea sp. NPDC049784 TaxID=3154361 RepID=UPI0033D34AD8
MDPAGHLLSDAQSESLHSKWTLLSSSGDGLPAVTFGNWLRAQHYTVVASYHPAGRFWPFQFIEAGWMGLLILLLGIATVWLLRRRIG